MLNPEPPQRRKKEILSYWESLFMTSLKFWFLFSTYNTTLYLVYLSSCCRDTFSHITSDPKTLPLLILSTHVVTMLDKTHFKHRYSWKHVSLYMCFKKFCAISMIDICQNYTNHFPNETHYCPLVGDSVLWWLGMDWSSTSWFFCQFSVKHFIYIVFWESSGMPSFGFML